MGKELEFQITWEVPGKVILNALIDPMEIMKFTRCKVDIESKEGGKFSILDGRISGTFIEIDQAKQKLVQEWKFNDWPSHSIVSITFKDSPEDDQSTMTLKQTEIPNNIDTDKLIDGWKAQIFQPMSKICGYPIED